jgi:hypothetical protein
MAAWLHWLSFARIDGSEPARDASQDFLFLVHLQRETFTQAGLRCASCDRGEALARAVSAVRYERDKGLSGKVMPRQE